MSTIRSLRVLVQWGARFFALLGFLLLFATLTPVIPWWTSALTGPWPETPRTGTLIVLSSEVLAQERLPGPSSYWRTVYAVRAWRANHFDRIVVSGMSPGPEAMAEFLVAGGVPVEKIELEKQSASTRENALGTAKLLRGRTSGPLVLLSSDFHMRRAAGVFRRAGLVVIPMPVPDAGKRGNNWQWRWTLAQELGLESVKLVYYWWRGWL